MSDVNSRPVFSTKALPEQSRSRRYAFSPVLLTATTAAAAQEVISAGDVETVVVNLSASNNSASAARMSVCIVDSGDSPSASNLAIENFEVAGYGVGELEIMLNPGQALHAYASTTSLIRALGWITAYL